MGRPMARNLMEAGYDLVVHNRSRGKIEELVGEGAQAAESPREVAESSSLVFTMLPGPPEVREVVTGEDGLLRGAGEGSLLVDMSTSSPVLARELARTSREQRIGMLDAPVSGGDVGAVEGTLSIMVGGQEEDFGRARPLFEAMGKSVVHVGESGSGQTVKACNQIVVAMHYAAVSEALVLGSKAGVAPEKVIEVLNGGLAASRVMEMRGPTMIEHNFQPCFRVNLHRKDLGIAMATGKEYEVPLPVSALVSQLYDALAIKGGGDLDHSALVTLFEDLAQHTVGE
jgi:2-hydroxy-3-oxopropionate reductase